MSVSLTVHGDRQLVLRRDFRAPCHLVFAAWTRPELLRRWYGADGWQLVECDVDLRVGGRWRFVSRGPGGARMGHSGTYTRVEGPRRLEFTEVFDAQSYPGETLVAHHFTDHDGGTTVTSTLTFATPFGRETVLGYPMRRGVTEGYRRLDAVLTDLEHTMNWTLEVVIVPVSDIDRAKAFYAERLGFAVDHDTRPSDDVRIVQLTPPGSGCSVVIGKGAVPHMEPGSVKGLQLVVADIHRARAQLLARGVEVGDVVLYGEGDPSASGPALDNIAFVHFSDPDGNTWAVQQISDRG